MFICEIHLNIIMSEIKYDCTSCKANDFYFVSIGKRVCMGCIRHSYQKLTFVFPSVDFSLVDSCAH